MKLKSYILLTFLCLLSSVIGGVVTLCLIPTTAKASTTDDIFRVKELRIAGENGTDEIILSTTESGPILRLMDSDKKQELRLEVKSNSDDAFRKSAITFWDAKKDFPVAFFSTTGDQSASLGMGHASYPDYVQIATSNSKKKPEAWISLGFCSTPYIEARATDKAAFLDINTPSSILRLNNELNKKPNIFSRDAGTRADAIVEFKK